MTQTDQNSGVTRSKLAALLGFALALFYTTTVQKWAFFDDDYGAIYTATTTKTWNDVKDFFGKRHNDQTILPSNLLEADQAFFTSSTFRPLTLVWYWLVSKILDPYQPFHYYLFSIFLHILATLLLFAAFTNYLPPTLAFWAALLFGIFPFNGKFLGRLVIEPYSLCLILNLMGYFWAQAYFTRYHLINLISAAICFLGSILMHEISYSYLLLYGAVLYSARLKDSSWPKSIFGTIADIIPFLAVLAICVFAKHTAYTQGSLGLLEMANYALHKLKFRLYDLVTLVVDTLGYSPIPGGNAILKSSLLLIDTILFLSLLIIAGNITALALICLFATQCWPSLLVMHVSRYLYFALPYLLLALFIMYNRLQNSSIEQILKILLQGKYFIILLAGFFAVRNDLAYFGKKFCFVDDAIQELSDKLIEQPDNTSLCFAGLPFDYFPVSGLAQAIWFYTKDNSRKIFYDPLHAVRFFKIDFLPDGNFCKVSHSKRNQLLRIRTNPKTSAYILITNPFGEKVPCSTGTLDYIKTNLANPSQTDRSATDIKIKLHEKFSPFKLVTWDNKQRSFRFLKP